MTKTELISSLADATELTKTQTEKVLGAFISTVADTLASGNDIRIAGLGTFSVKSRPAREGRNPRTGETIKIAASKSPTFKAGKELKDKVNA